MSEQASESPDVIGNAGRSQFELHGDGELTELAYQRHGDELVLIHTGVRPSWKDAASTTSWRRPQSTEPCGTG